MIEKYPNLSNIWSDSMLKKLLVASTVAALAVTLVACQKKEVSSEAIEASAPVSEATETSSSTPVAEEVQTVVYTSTDGKKFTLTSSDTFETATLTDNDGKSYPLKSAISASGMRLEGNDGIYIHVKGGEGTVEIVANQPIDITEVK